MQSLSRKLRLRLTSSRNALEQDQAASRLRHRRSAGRLSAKKPMRPKLASCVDKMCGKLGLPGLLAFTNPISRTCKTPNHPSGRKFECSVRPKQHLRHLTEHGPTKSMPRRGNDGRTAALAPFHREAMPVIVSPLQAPRDVDVAGFGREGSVFARINGELVQRHANCLGRRGSDPEIWAAHGNAAAKKISEMSELHAYEFASGTFCHLLLASRS